MREREAWPGRVIVFGSAHEDFVLSVPHLPVPGETLLARSFDRVLGGKGANQAVAAARAGGDVVFVGRVGSDAAGERVAANLADHGVDVGGLVRSDRAQTGIAVVVVDDHGTNHIVVASGASGEVGAADLASGASLSSHDVVVLQCEVPTSAVAQVLTEAQRVGARTVLNLAPFTPLDDAVLAQATVLIVNETEALGLTGSGVPVDRRAEAIAARLHTTCIVTLGADGSRAASPDTEPVTIAAEPVDEVVDTTGAGDVYVGTVAAALARGAALPAAMSAGSRAAARAVSGWGAQHGAPVSDGESVAPHAVN